mmetsp:Transcript_44599/g.127938  ORF Transcript_44599/g.127938 Transcript_44599/m.127938 type:complete len:574 (+) Transcript_44599:183-1904(+)
MPVPEERVAEIRTDIASKSSATATVQIVRRLFERSWDVAWGADALLCIARRSNAQTRKEWAKDEWVIALGERLKLEISSVALGIREEAASKIAAYGDAYIAECAALLGRRLDAELTAMEALRRMNFQDLAAQGGMLLRTAEEVEFLGWGSSPAQRLARFLWLAAPLPRQPPPGLRLVPALLSLRHRHSELGAPDIVLLLAALRSANVIPVQRALAALRDVDVALPPEDITPGGATANIDGTGTDTAWVEEGFRLSLDVTPAGAAPGASSSPSALLVLRRRGAGAVGAAAEASGDSVLLGLWLAPGISKLLLAWGGAPPAVKPEVEGVTDSSSRKDSRKNASKRGQPAPLPPPDVLPLGRTSRLTLLVSGEEAVVLVDGKEVLKAPRFAAGGSAAPRPLRELRLRALPEGGEGEASSDSWPVAVGTVANVTYRPLHHLALCDATLLERVARRLRSEEIYSGLPVADLVELGEAFSELDVKDEAALRTLGQEILQRRAEFTSAELWRLRVAFQTCGLPLDAVWADVGFKRKNTAGFIVTQQAFAPQKGHEKRQRGSEQDVERASPPRHVNEFCLH